MISIYGLKNCDTCRAALKWLVAAGLSHRFVDIRKDGVEESQVSAWAAALGWEALLNRRGTTWRRLCDSGKENIDEATADVATSSGTPRDPPSRSNLGARPAPRGGAFDMGVPAESLRLCVVARVLQVHQQGWGGRLASVAERAPGAALVLCAFAPDRV